VGCWRGAGGLGGPNATEVGKHNLYGPLLDPRRESVLNVTEIGVLFGSSVLMWADYFPKANITELT